MTDIFDFDHPPMSRQLLAGSELGQARTVDEVLNSVEMLQGQVPDGDLILAALRRCCALDYRFYNLSATIDDLDNIINS